MEVQIQGQGLAGQSQVACVDDGGADAIDQAWYSTSIRKHWGVEARQGRARQLAARSPEEDQAQSHLRTTMVHLLLPRSPDLPFSIVMKWTCGLNNVSDLRLLTNGR